MKAQSIAQTEQPAKKVVNDTLRMVLMTDDTWQEIVQLAEKLDMQNPEAVIAYALQRLKQELP